MLSAGGNAIDAGVAAGICLGTVHPDMVSVGGVAPIIVHVSRTGETWEVSGVGPYPRASTLEFFRERHGNQIAPGLARTVVPAAPAAWGEGPGAMGDDVLRRGGPAVHRARRAAASRLGVLGVPDGGHAEKYRALAVVRETLSPRRARPTGWASGSCCQSWPRRSRVWLVPRRRPAARARPVSARPWTSSIAGRRPSASPSSTGARAAAPLRRPRRLSGRGRARPAHALRRVRGRDLRLLVPGAGPSPDAEPARRRRSRAARPQFAGLSPSPDRDGEAGLRRPRRVLRRSHVRQGPRRAVALQGLCRRAGRSSGSDPGRRCLRG